MKLEWTTEAIITHFTLQSEEQAWLGSSDPHNHLGKALQGHWIAKGRKRAVV